VKLLAGPVLDTWQGFSLALHCFCEPKSGGMLKLQFIGPKSVRGKGIGPANQISRKRG